MSDSSRQFDKKLYKLAALEDALKVYEDFATMDLDRSGEAWTVTFTETNWLDVTIERVAVRYDERGGRSYWISVDGEWRDVSFTVPAGGTDTYSGWVRTDDDDDMRNIMGGKLKFRYRGTDAEGNAISGSVNAVLVRPED